MCNVKSGYTKDLSPVQGALRPILPKQHPLSLDSPFCDLSPLLTEHPHCPPPAGGQDPHLGECIVFLGQILDDFKVIHILELLQRGCPPCPAQRLGGERGQDSHRDRVPCPDPAPGRSSQRAPAWGPCGWVKEERAPATGQVPAVPDRTPGTGGGTPGSHAGPQ